MAEEDHEDEERYGIALGFRIFEHQGELFLAEAEITPYVDDPGALGATLVFHPLTGIDPTAVEEEIDWETYPIDIDDQLSRDPDDTLPKQFRAIARQLSELSESELRQHLRHAREGTQDT